MAEGTLGRDAERRRKRELQRLQHWIEHVRFDRTKAQLLAGAQQRGRDAGPPALNPTTCAYVMAVSW